MGEGYELCKAEKELTFKELNDKLWKTFFKKSAIYIEHPDLDF